MAASHDHLEGGSVWDEEVYQLFRQHVSEEEHIIASYRRLASDASPDVAYLVNLIVEDERRHHRIFEELAATLRQVVEVEPGDKVVPDVPLRRSGSQGLRAALESLLSFERADASRLRRLRRSLRAVSDTTIWPLLVESMELDTKKHVLFLRYLVDKSSGIFGQ